MTHGTVIIGASHAGVQAAASLRDLGYTLPITLVSDEDVIPYHRPPLSKAYMTGGHATGRLNLRGESFYEEGAIALALGHRAVSLDRQMRVVILADGRHLPYDRVILATGARNRFALTEETPRNVVGLRSLADASLLHALLSDFSGRVVIAGGGYIGLELAGTLRSHFDLDVTVVHRGARLLSRVTSPELAALLTERHRAAGCKIRTSDSVVGWPPSSGRVNNVILSDGSLLRADLVIMGTGVVPNDALARNAGLLCANGIVVDSACRTSDPEVLAIGDCSEHPGWRTNMPTRLESVQNALDQARIAARTIFGQSAEYNSVPWFWSDQLGLKLQIAGTVLPDATVVRRGDPEGGKGSFYLFDQSHVLQAVESVNAPADHMLARRLLENHAPVSPAQVADPSFNLRDLTSRAPAPMTAA